MRRLLAVGCTLALLAALIVPVAAQPVLLGPGGLLNNTTASVAITNTTTATSMYSYTVPAGMTQGAYAPLHLVLFGRLSTNQGVGATGNINLGCNYGGTPASIALINAQAPLSGLSNAPFKLDLWVVGYGTQATAINGWLQGELRVATQSVPAASQAVYNAAVDVLTLPGTPNTITCVWAWGSAAATNSVVITNGHLVVGN